MTKEELEKLLPIKIDCKTSEISRKVQKKLIELDFEWFYNDKSVNKNRYPYLFVDENKDISWSNTFPYFKDYSYKEVKPEEILNINKKEPNYKKYEKLKKAIKNLEE
jgi:hypothetical protein